MSIDAGTVEPVDCMDSDESGDSIEGYDDFEPEITKCLFCEDTSHGVDDAMNHLRSSHNVDLGLLKARLRMDQYSYLKMVNFIRREKADASTIASAKEVLWDDEKYLKPLDYEPWLCYDFDELEPFKSEINSNTADSSNPEVLIKNLKEQIRQKDELLQQAMEDIEKMRKSFKTLMEQDMDTDEKPKNCVSSMSVKADEGYFSTYSHFGIHHDMLSDTVRTSSYRDALLGNKNFIEAKTVLDVGCGTSILSMFASQAGAEIVVAVDNSDIIYNAMGISRKNNFKNIEFVKGRLEDTHLPVDKFDVIVSEWMGYFLLFEGMLDSIIYARDRHLKPGGIILPNRCNISLVGYGDEARFQEYISFWDSVYGFDMSSMKKEVLQEPLVEVCKSAYVLTEPNILVDYDMNTVDLNYSNFSYNFNLKVIKSGKITSFVGYFDTFFDLPNKVLFSTSPHDKPTHWKQVVFFLDSTVEVKENDVITGKIVCERNRKDLRSLKIKLNVFSKEYCYHLD